jgi:hypothetical protein
MKKNNLMLIVALIVLIAIAMIWVLKNSNSNMTTPPTTPNQTFENLPQGTDMPLEGLNIAPETIPAN